ncbi:TonB-dependent receptor plug domain-containing protein [Thioflexithrix psekupsensis]|uniref:TonB-dependent receptor n=1 Tax=Thioflexithrix psekupsensis TaxID=1570016 RepID=A0A251X7X7_9GAMM|nr:TonB-dependent receptor [Thioflexithrix psekupsensis]OUD14040.1 hypothetical protein TPSD3_06790 [Thioflexithrix psekupsensis]
MKHHFYGSFLSFCVALACHANDDQNLDDVKKLMSLSLLDLMSVEIETAGKTVEKISVVPASVVLVTRQDIQRYGYSRLTDILDHVSGMYKLDNYGPSGPAYGVRGYLAPSSTNRNIIVLINGVNHVSDYDSTYFFSSINVPVEAIDRIEIVRGPQSTIYGSGASFGVINIITNEVHQEQGYASSVSASVGTNGIQRRTARSSYKYEKGQVVVNLGYYRDDGHDQCYTDLSSRQYPVAPDFSTKDHLEKAETYVDISASYQDFSVDLTHNKNRTGGLMTNPVSRSGTIRYSESTRLRLNYKTDLSEQWALNAHLTYAHINAYYDYDSISATDLWSVQTERSRSYEGEVTLNWKASEKIDWLSGLYYRHTPELSTYIDIPPWPIPSLNDSTQRLAPGEALVKRALFSQISYTQNEQWKWVAGLRLEEQLGYDAAFEYGYTPEQYRSWNFYYDKQDVTLIPRLAVIYTPNETHLFKLMYGKAINSPSFGQNTTARINPNLPSLENEEIETIELNYLTSLTPQYGLTANIFHNRLKNLLSRTVTSSADSQYVVILGNSGSWSTNGLELGLRGNPADQWQFELNLTYQETNNQDNSTIKAAYSPSLLGQLKLSYQLNSQWSLGMTGYYVSKMSLFFDSTLKNSDGSFGRYITGEEGNDYFILGTNVRFQDWLAKGTYLNLHINNLLDQKIVYPTYPRATWMDKGTIGEERQFILSLGYDF